MTTACARPPAPAEPTDSETVPAPRRLRRAVLLLLVLGCLLGVRTWVAEPLRIVTGSMEPTLVPGEHVAAWKLDAPWRTWQRGDVVVLDRQQGRLLVKRIVATEGDVVGLRDGRLVVNGRRVRESYADPRRIDSVYFGPVRVPDGHVFVLGDRRSGSVDSRTFGPVPTSDMRGRVVAVLWPPASLTTRVTR